jgi:hypothetical protein
MPVATDIVLKQNVGLWRKWLTRARDVIDPTDHAILGLT